MALKKKERRRKRKSLATTGQSNNYKNYLKIPRICNLFFHACIFLVLLVLKGWDRGNPVGLCKVQMSLWNNSLYPGCPHSCCCDLNMKGRKTRKSDRPGHFSCVSFSQWIWSLKGVSLLAGLIHGDEAEEGLMRMVLEIEPCEASMGWDRAKFIPEMQEHLVRLQSLFPLYIHPENRFFPLTQKHKELSAVAIWPLGQRCGEPRTWDLPRAEGAKHLFYIPSSGAAPPSLQFGEPNLGFWAWAAWESVSLLWDLFPRPGCSATELTWNRALEQKHVLSDL